jgi:hypothetical protein
MSCAPRRNQGAKSVGSRGSTTTSVLLGNKDYQDTAQAKVLEYKCHLRCLAFETKSLSIATMTYIPTSHKTLYFLALLGLLQRTHGQALQGCAAVNCPNRYENMLSPTRQVESTDMRLVGLLSTSSSLLASDLTWTIGDSGLQSTIVGNERTVTRSFYVGTPKSVDLTSAELEVKGCAIFVISPDTGAYQVYEQDAPQYVNRASCAGSMGETCVKDLTSKVEELTRSTSDQSANTFCKNIADGLREAPPSSCYILDQQPRIEAVALTGSTALQPITSNENSTSNCWPTLPRTNDLTKVFEYDHVANLTEWVPWLGYTPLITVFASGNATSDIEVDLACMKIVDSDDFSAGTARNGSDTTVMEGSAVSSEGGWRVFGLVVGIWLAVLL